MGPRGATATAEAETATGDAPRTSFITASGLPDYYEVLGVDDDASPEVLKSAYRSLAKSCHPDFLGQQGHNICILLNEAYAVLSHPDTRAEYNLLLEQALADEDDTFTGQPISKWLVGTPRSKAEDEYENRGVFVDELSCIGCKQCVWIAPGTFRIEPDHGRSRAFAQWAENEDDTQAAIDSCPVSCIHWVQKEELAALEWVMQVHMTSRVNVGAMMCGQGGGIDDVFTTTHTYMKKREAKIKAREADQKYSKAQMNARRRAAADLEEQKAGPWWSRMGAAFGLGNLTAMANSYVRSDVGDARVGSRKRARPVAADPGQLSDGRGTIPLERSLVSVSSLDSSWDDV